MKHIPYVGGRITEAGIYSRVPMSAYHRGDICDGPSVSSTGLRKIIRDSLKHFYSTSALNPRRVEGDADEKKHFIMGRAVHHLVLGEALFSKTFIVRPDTYVGKNTKTKKLEDKPWNGNADFCKDWMADARKAGRTPLTSADMHNIRGMMMALGKEPLVNQGILNGDIERSMFWKDKRTGIWLKARPDVIPSDSADIVDLKITRSTAWLDIQTAIGVGRSGYGYIQQGALVAEGYRRIYGRDISSFSLCFIEHAEPYDVYVVTLEPEDLKRGHELNEIALERLWKALKNDEWPGRAGVQHDAHSLALSDRERERIDNYIKHGVMG